MTAHFRVTTMTRQGLTDVADFEIGDAEARARAHLAATFAKPDTMVAALFGREIPAAPAWPGDWNPVEMHQRRIPLMTTGEVVARAAMAESVSARAVADRNPLR